MILRGPHCPGLTDSRNGGYYPPSLRSSEHPAIPVLDYLARCERAASARNLRDYERHYRDGWNLLFGAVYGAMPAPFLRSQPLSYCAPEKPRVLKPWELAKYSRPMRRVIGRFIMERQGERIGQKYTVTMLKLECGHLIEEFSFWANDKPALRRRCPQCAKESHAAHVVEARRRAAGAGA